MLDKQAFIRGKAARSSGDPAERTVLWSRHAITKLVGEDLTRQEVERGLTSCEVIEDYPAVTRPLPDCLVLARLPTGGALHAVVACDKTNDRILIVTVYTPDPSRWEHDYRTRKE